MDEKNKKMLLIAAGVLGGVLLLLMICLFAMSGKDDSKEVVSPDPETIEVQEKQIQSFQDIQLIEDTLASGKQLDENIGRELTTSDMSVLQNLGVSEELFDSYKVYTSNELLNSKFVLIGDEVEEDDEGSEFIVVEDDEQVQEWTNNYGDDEYIISQSQGLAFLLNGREDEYGIVQHARLVEDNENFDENMQDNTTENNTIINIRKVERLKYNVSIIYPKDALNKKYAILENEKEDENSSEVEDSQETVDYDKLKWLNYEDNIFIDENVTIYTKYKLSKEDDEYTIGNSKAVPELVLSTPVYEIVEDDTVYLKFSSIESEYNDNIKFKVSYGIKQGEEEPVYSEWDKLDNNIFKVEEQEKYFIKFAAILPNKNVTESPEQTISMAKTDNDGSVENPDGETEIKSNNTNLKDVKINGKYLSTSIISELNEKGTAEYSLSSASSVTVKAEAEDANASVVGNGIFGFKNNKVTIKLQIVADDDTKKIVTINVTRESSSSGSSSSSSSSSSSGNTSKSCSHSWQSATCTTPRTCTKCGSTSGSPSSHSWQAATCTTPKTCKKCGTTSGSVLGHNWKAATCTTPKTCKRCKVTSGSELGHNWQAATCQQPKKCSRCNVKEGDKLEHIWGAATCTKPATCTRSGCNATTGKALGHDFSIAATCQHPKTCTKCGATTGSVASHKWKAATCAKPKTCTVCGTTSGNPLNHNWVTVNGVKKCSLCGKKAS